MFNIVKLSIRLYAQLEKSLVELNAKEIRIQQENVKLQRVRAQILSINKICLFIN